MITAYDPATHPRGCDCATCCRVAAVGRWSDGVEALAAAYRTAVAS